MGAPTIVIVDDEVVVGGELEAQLRGLGYRIAGIASTGLEGIRLVQQTQPDLVLMETVLPGDIDGTDAASVIRARWGISIIYLTARADEPTLLRARVTKPDAFLIKPCSHLELRANLEMALYKHQAELKFQAALEKHDPDERSACLDEACAGDPALRRRAESLLKSVMESGTIQLAPDQRVAQTVQALSPSAGREPQSSQSSEGKFAFLDPPREPGFLCRMEHYDVMQLIGNGAMGFLFQAFDAALHRIVAIKVLAPQLATTANARRRFLREARAMAAIRNDYVIDVYAVGETQGIPFLVMEFIAGSSLAHEIYLSGGLDLPKLVRVAYQTACGLAAAHAQGLIHRDIKPSNILLEHTLERIKITDFGLARAADDPGLTQLGTISGTPQFMAPEQASGDRVDHRCDLFSLGSVLYAMCTGRAPYQGASTMSVLRQVCDEAPQPIRELNPDVPCWLIEIIGKLQAKSPCQRFQSATEVADAFKPYLNGWGE
jgi:eukaryotic-like serine/threonine-protein kinase